MRAHIFTLCVAETRFYLPVCLLFSRVIQSLTSSCILFLSPLYMFRKRRSQSVIVQRHDVPRRERKGEKESPRYFRDKLFGENSPYDLRARRYACDKYSVKICPETPGSNIATIAIFVPRQVAKKPQLQKAAARARREYVASFKARPSSSTPGPGSSPGSPTSAGHPLPFLSPLSSFRHICFSISFSPSHPPT